MRQEIQERLKEQGRQEGQKRLERCERQKRQAVLIQIDVLPTVTCLGGNILSTAGALVVVTV